MLGIVERMKRGHSRQPSPRNCRFIGTRLMRVRLKRIWMPYDAVTTQLLDQHGQIVIKPLIV